MIRAAAWKLWAVVYFLRERLLDLADGLEGVVAWIENWADPEGLRLNT